MKEKIELTYSLYLRMGQWFDSNLNATEVAFIEKFFTSGTELDYVYKYDWVDNDRLTGDSFEESWYNHVTDKLMGEDSYNKVREFFETAYRNTIGYKEFLELFEEINYEYAENPLKISENQHISYIEPEVQELYFARLSSFGWKRAGNRKRKKAVFKNPYSKFKAKKYYFKGNYYMAVSKGGTVIYGKK